MRALVIGASGLLGSALIKASERTGVEAGYAFLPPCGRNTTPAMRMLPKLNAWQSMLRAEVPGLCIIPRTHI